MNKHRQSILNSLIKLQREIELTTDSFKKAMLKDKFRTMHRDLVKGNY